MTNHREIIQSKIIELAKQSGHDARKLQFNENIPATGLLDSGALMELIVWYEGQFDIEIDQDEITVENFGTIDAMVAYLEKNQK